MDTTQLSTQLAALGAAAVPWWGWLLGGLAAAEAMLVWSLCRAAARLGEGQPPRPLSRATVWKPAPEAVAQVSR